jgi:hypothetical protein
MIWQVPVISQSSLYLCWEACGRMLFGWRYKNNPQCWKIYAQKAGIYTQVNQGLTEPRMDSFYRQLGIRSLKNPSGKNIRHALKWTPVIVTSTKQATGHAIVIIGHNGLTYSTINPCGVQVVDFGNPSGSSCTAASIPLKESEIENSLGEYIWYW